MPKKTLTFLKFDDLSGNTTSFVSLILDYALLKENKKSQSCNRDNLA